MYHHDTLWKASQYEKMWSAYAAFALRVSDHDLNGVLEHTESSESEEQDEDEDDDDQSQGEPHEN